MGNGGRETPRRKGEGLRGGGEEEGIPQNIIPFLYFRALNGSFTQQAGIVPGT